MGTPQRVLLRIAVPGHYDRVVRGDSEIGLCGIDHPFDMSTGRDERVESVPIGIASVKNSASAKVTEIFLSVGAGS
jgi:hypothetical protein